MRLKYISLLFLLVFTFTVAPPSPGYCFLDNLKKSMEKMAEDLHNGTKKKKTSEAKQEGQEVEVKPQTAEPPAIQTLSSEKQVETGTPTASKKMQEKDPALAFCTEVEKITEGTFLDNNDRSDNNTPCRNRELYGAVKRHIKEPNKEVWQYNFRSGFFKFADVKWKGVSRLFWEQPDGPKEGSDAYKRHQDRVKVNPALYDLLKRTFPDLVESVDARMLKEFNTFKTQYYGDKEEKDQENLTLLTFLEEEAFGPVKDEVRKLKERVVGRLEAAKSTEDKNKRLFEEGRNSGIRTELFGINSDTTPDQVKQYIFDSHFNVQHIEKRKSGVWSEVFSRDSEEDHLFRVLEGGASDDKVGRRVTSCYGFDITRGGAPYDSYKYIIEHNCFSAETNKLLQVRLSFVSHVEDDVIIDKLSAKFGREPIIIPAQGADYPIRYWMTADGVVAYLHENGPEVEAIFLDNARKAYEVLLSKPEPAKAGSDLEF